MTQRLTYVIISPVKAMRERVTLAVPTEKPPFGERRPENTSAKTVPEPRVKRDLTSLTNAPGQFRNRLKKERKIKVEPC